MRAALTALLALPLSGCFELDRPPAQDAGPLVEEPDLFCPGGPSCPEEEGAPLLAGAAARVVTPDGFEIARASYLRNDRPDACAPEAPVEGGARRCGELKKTIYDDCGTDGICFGEEGYPGRDADGSEADGALTDWFWDCGRDRLCPPPFDTPEEGALADNGFDDDGDGAVDEGAWTAPDEDGSEGDGLFQGLWIAGYGNNRPAMGVKDDLWARAVVLRQGQTTLAFVTIDAVGLFYDEQQKIAALIEAARPGEVDLVLVQASHTHEAPDTMGQWGLEDPFAGLQYGHGRDDAHMEKIRLQSRDAVLEALDELVPVEVKVGAVQTRVEGFLHDGRDPQIFNDTLTALQLVEVGGGPTVATLVNWGNHPETLDSRNNFISSDYLHASRAALEAGLPATDRFPARPGLGGVALYVQGAVGGLMGPNGFPIEGRDGTVHDNARKTFARTDAYGELVAEQAFQALEQAEVLEAPRLRFSQRAYKAPVKNQVFHVGLFNGWFDRALFDFDESRSIGEGNWPTLETGVAVLFLGEVGVVTAPGELFPETFVGFDPSMSLGVPTIRPDNPNPPDLEKAPGPPYLKDLLGVRYPMAFGLCQDEIGYLVPPYDFELDESAPYIDQPEGDHYEETNSIGPDAVPLFLENAEKLFAFEAGRAD